MRDERRMSAVRLSNSGHCTVQIGRSVYSMRCRPALRCGMWCHNPNSKLLSTRDLYAIAPRKLARNTLSTSSYDSSESATAALGATQLID